MRKMSDSGQSSAPTRVAGSTAGVCREQTIRALSLRSAVRGAGSTAEVCRDRTIRARSLRSLALPPGPPRSRHTPAASRLSVTAALARHTSAASCCAPPPPVCGVLATFRCGQHSALSRHTPWMSFNRKETR